MRLQAQWIARDLFRHRGVFRLGVFSAHRQVINLEAEGWPHLLVLAGPDLFRAPAALGLAGKDLDAVAAEIGRVTGGRLAQERLVLEGTGIRFTISWDGKPALSFGPPDGLNAPPARVRENLDRCRGVLMDRPPASAAAVLLGAEGGEPFFRDAYRRHFSRILAALAESKEQEFSASCQSIIGLGRGSTPTGDDLICGALLAARYYDQWSSGRRGWKPPRLPPGWREATTALSAHSLELSRRGLAAAPVREHLTALFTGTWREDHLHRLLATGSTTGYDLAVAIQAAVEMWTDFRESL